MFMTQGEECACHWRQKHETYGMWILFSTCLGGLRYPTDVIRKQPLGQNVCFT